jgi:hypothetical protein
MRLRRVRQRLQKAIYVILCSVQIGRDSQGTAADTRDHGSLGETLTEDLSDFTRHFDAKHVGKR